MFSYLSRRRLRGALVITILAGPTAVSAQTRDGSDSLVALALALNPRIRAVDAQAAAARARIAPAGARPDPMLMAGIQNLPLGRDPGAMPGPDPMTMKMVGVSQTIPYPGKTSLRTRIARAEAADARATAVRPEVKRDVLGAYYDLVAARMLLGIVGRQQDVAAGILPATEARYVSGSAAQADVLKARNEAAALVQERNALTQEERAALARLNGALDQPSNAPVKADSLPPSVMGATLLPSLDSLQSLAQTANPRLVERRAMIAAQMARAELARRGPLPDFDVSIQYGQRDRLPDMITALISVPVPIQRGRKQDAEVKAATLDVSAAEAELRVEENAVRSEVARLRASLFVSLLIITLSFIPVFALEAQEGRLFHPLAWTKTLAMAAAALLSVTLVPVMMGSFIRGGVKPEESNPVNRALIHAYRPVLRFGAGTSPSDARDHRRFADRHDPALAAPRERVHAAAE